MGLLCVDGWENTSIYSILNSGCTTTKCAINWRVWQLSEATVFEWVRGKLQPVPTLLVSLNPKAYLTLPSQNSLLPSQNSLLIYYIYYAKIRWRFGSLWSSTDFFFSSHKNKTRGKSKFGSWSLRPLVHPFIHIYSPEKYCIKHLSKM